MSAIAWSWVFMLSRPSPAVFIDMRLDPGYMETQKHLFESAETDVQCCDDQARTVKFDMLQNQGFPRAAA